MEVSACSVQTVSCSVCAMCRNNLHACNKTKFDCPNVFQTASANTCFALVPLFHYIRCCEVPHSYLFQPFLPLLSLEVASPPPSAVTLSSVCNAFSPLIFTSSTHTRPHLGELLGVLVELDGDLVDACALSALAAGAQCRQQVRVLVRFEQVRAVLHRRVLQL